MLMATRLTSLTHGWRLRAMFEAVKIIASLMGALLMVFATAAAVGLVVLTGPALAGLAVGLLTQSMAAGEVASYLAAPVWLIALYAAGHRRRRF